MLIIFLGGSGIDWCKLQLGTQYLNVYAYYSAHERTRPSISLNTRFLQHYCLSKNFQTGVWSLGSSVSA